MKRSFLWLLCFLMIVPAGLAEDVVSMDDIVVEDSLLTDLTDSVQIEDLPLVQESELSSNAPGDGQTPPDKPEGSEGQTPPGDGGQPGGSTDEQSGTYATYATLLPGFDSLMARKRAKGAIEEFTPQSPEDFLTTKLDKDWSRVVVLQNNYYNIFDEAGVNGRDSAYEAAVIDSVRDTVRLPLYVYMVVEKGEDDRFYIKANSLKGRFLRKVGYEFSSKSQNLCSWMDEDLIK
jgi:hypothetical protein